MEHPAEGVLVLTADGQTQLRHLDCIADDPIIDRAPLITPPTRQRGQGQSDYDRAVARAWLCGLCGAPVPPHPAALGRVRHRYDQVGIYGHSAVVMTIVFDRDFANGGGRRTAPGVPVPRQPPTAAMAPWDRDGRLLPGARARRSLVVCSRGLAAE